MQSKRSLNGIKKLDWRYCFDTKMLAISSWNFNKPKAVAQEHIPLLIVIRFQLWEKSTNTKLLKRVEKYFV